jgi:hypothetical protein
LKIVEILIVEKLEENPNWKRMKPAVLARAVSRVKANLLQKLKDVFFFKIHHELLP